MKTLIVLAKTGSVEEAAKALKTSVAQVSVGLRTIEDEVGHTLFRRTANGMILTPEGNKMLLVAHEILLEATPKTSKRHHQGE